jgi:hypothetical protein
MEGGLKVLSATNQKFCQPTPSAGTNYGPLSLSIDAQRGPVSFLKRTFNFEECRTKIPGQRKRQCLSAGWNKTGDGKSRRIENDKDRA